MWILLLVLQHDFIVLTGPCVRDRAMDQQQSNMFNCKDDGTYAPLQCQPPDSEKNYNCRCVLPNGTAIPNSQHQTTKPKSLDCADIGMLTNNIVTVTIRYLHYV